MRLTAFVLLLSLLFSGCSKTEEKREVLPVEGKWTLLYFSSGSDQEIFNKDEIIWEFNKYDELIVTINIVLPPDSQLPIKQSGTYPYVASKKVISIEGTQYAVQRTDNVLILDHNSAAGGTRLQFELTE